MRSLNAGRLQNDMECCGCPTLAALLGKSVCNQLRFSPGCASAQRFGTPSGASGSDCGGGGGGGRRGAGDR
jgi:hypothetical protein